MNKHKIKVSLVDDHKLFRKGMVSMFQLFDTIEVVSESENGREFMDLLKSKKIEPDVVLLDYNMPELNGPETAMRIHQFNSNIKILALSMFEDEEHIIKMIKSGAHGYLLKDSDPEEIEIGIITVMDREVYYTDHVSKALSNALQKSNLNNRTLNLANVKIELNEKEKKYLFLICQELSHKNIADHMNVSERTVDGYRDRLCEKVGVKNKVGLVRYAVKNGLDVEN